MAKPFDLKKQLKLQDKGLLRRLFVERFQVLGDVPWETLKPHEVDPIIEGWSDIPEKTRKELEVVLQDVNELSDERSQRVLIEELGWQCPDKREAYGGWKSLYDKALWAYLEASEAFNEAAIYARAEALRYGHYSNRWNSLPKKKLVVSDTLREKLEQSICAYYHEKELREDKCRVHHYQRGNGADYFYAYLPEWADKRLGFDDEGNLTPQELNYAFHNVFIYEPDTGALEIIAKGGKSVQLPLRRAFCKSVLDVTVEDTDPIARTYELNHLLDPSFAFRTEPEDRVAVVRLRRVRIMPSFSDPIVEWSELRFHESASLADVWTAVHKYCKSFGLLPSQLRILQVSIQIEFQSNGRQRPKTMTFNVSTPNTCDLKSKADDVRVVGERCIRRWRILRD